jgi:hypothetical protein
MNELTGKISKLLLDNGISKKDLLNTLANVYQEIELSFWEHCNMTPMIFYNIKDIIWYNLEHLPNGGEIRGLSDLRFLGTVYPNLIYCCNDTNIIELEDIPKLLLELDDIINKWNRNWNFVSLYTKSNNGWQGGQEASKVIIVEGNESPTKYGYNSTYGKIVGVNGKNIVKYDIDTVICTIDVPIGEYVQGHILYHTLFQLKECCKRAIKNQKDIMIDFQTIEF